MKYISIFLYLIGFSIFGLAQQTIDGTLMHDGLEREYILYVPANYTGNAAVPLIFNFHGYTNNATQQINSKNRMTSDFLILFVNYVKE